MRACSSTNLSVLLEKYMYGVRKSKSWLSLSLCSGYILIWLCCREVLSPVNKVLIWE